MATGKTIQRDLSVDTDPITPQRDISYRPSYSLSSSNVSADALAGPQDASRRSTQELKQEAKLAEMEQKKERPGNLIIDNLSQKSYSRSRSSGQHEVDQVVSVIRSKVEDMSINKGGDSSYGSMSSSESPGDSFGCSSMPSASWEDELKFYTDKMPPHLRLGYIDVLILYSEDDREKAEKFKEHLIKDIDVGPDGPVLALLYDDAEMQAICGSKIQHIAKGVERSTYVFIFMTKNFIQDKWCEFSSESCLMQAIENPDKQWCVVPVYTEKRNSTFRVPMGLNTLKGINYYNNDRFYKNGVSRLIGDKVYVRIKMNEEHKMKQKVWLEEHKREQIKIKEMQRCVEEHEKAKTQQWLAWLDKETKDLIHAGKLPNYIPHSSSESDIPNSGSDMTHSSSTSSLKPVHPQNPAVTAYFQQLLSQQKLYGRNEKNYTQQEIGFIEQMYGSTSPLTPGLYSNNSPLMMNQYRNQFAPGNFPPSPNSATYQHNVKRSTSQTSADMGPSTQFVLHTETGDVSVPVPTEIVDRIKGETYEDQQEYVKSYLNQMQQQAVLQNQSNYDSGTPSSRFESSLLPQDLSAAHGNTGQISGNPNQIPNFAALSYNNASGSFHTNSSSRTSSRSLPSGSSGSMPSSQHQSEPGLGSNVDGNRSHPEVIGNIPMISGFSLASNNTPDHDGDSSLPPQAQPNPVTGRRKQDYEQRSVGDKIGDSDSDDEELRKGRKKKLRERKVVKIYNIYQASNVQIGEHNVVLEQSSEQLGDEHSEDEEERISGDSEVPLSENKSGTAKDTSDSSVVKPQMMKVDIKSGSQTHGEIPDQPNSSNSSCNVDAAPSTVRNITSSFPQEPVATKQKQAFKNIDEDEEIEEASEVFPETKFEESENLSVKKYENSSKFDESCEILDKTSVEKNLTFEESCNLNSTASIEKSLKQKIMPLNTTPKQQTKVTGVVKPVAAVSPYGRISDDDNYDDNCDNTDPKTLLETSQTVRKTVVSSKGGACCSEQTFVKQAWCERVSPPSVELETEQLQRELPAQILTKSADSGEESVNNGNATFAMPNQSDVQRLFFSRQYTPISNEEDEFSSIEMSAVLSGPQEVALGNDPLTRIQEDPASRSFIPQSSPFTPQENDLEFDMLESGNYESATYPNQNSTSMEESGTRRNGSWNRKGSPTGNSKKECVIS